MNKINRKMASFVALIGFALAASGCGGNAVVPASYKTYNAKNGAFQIQYPAEWELEGGGGKGGNAWVKFTSGGAMISVDANVVGSLMADIAKTGSPIMIVQGNQEDNAPVAAVHEQERQAFEDDGSVKEEKAAAVQTGLIDARQSEYDGKTTFGGTIRGYRVTALSSDTRIRIVCQCPDAEWSGLKPSFDKVIASVAMGKPQ